MYPILTIELTSGKISCKIKTSVNADNTQT